MLFETWWNRYVDTADPEDMTVDDTPESVGFAATASRLFRQPWSAARPLDTPFGLADPERAVDAFRWAVNETRAVYGRWDLSWGDVHRARLARVDVPVGGCTGLLGCFRVLWFDEQPDDNGQLAVRGGDGWVLAVEFAETPRAYSVLAYGQSSNEESPHHSDQLATFADNRMTPVVFNEDDVKRATIREYRPGAE